MSWIQTFTGKRFDLLNPSKENLDILDIAHSLSMLCRFVGHCQKFYSVAEHSIRVSYLVSGRSKLGALLHDASEAYLGDISGPWKSIDSFLVEKEKEIRNLICSRYRVLSDTDWSEIKAADYAMRAVEAKSLMYWLGDTKLEDWDLPVGVADDAEALIKVPWSPLEAKERFLNLYLDYSGSTKLG